MLRASSVALCAAVRCNSKAEVNSPTPDKALIGASLVRLTVLQDATAALCYEMAEIVQKVTLVGYIDFGSSWLLFLGVSIVTLLVNFDGL